ncbi:hypothetical protein M0802_000486 [Mischocyttarus mexicanus]|nr:hypothetical protein M0802_000486 [Mischocyttarus mexicanus]
MVYTVAQNIDRCFYGSLVNDVFLLDKISTIIADDGNVYDVDDNDDDEDDDEKDDNENSSINDTLVKRWL